MNTSTTGDRSVAIADDVVTGSAAANVITTGAGNDIQNGAAGADFMAGGAGEDTAYYGDKTSSVTADPDGAAGDDGTLLEHDSILADVEDIWGGSGNDYLSGTDGRPQGHIGGGHPGGGDDADPGVLMVRRRV